MSEIKFWRYTVPSIGGIEGWGIFLLDSTGMFSCVTDYGNYAYKWTHHGMNDFREFFAHDKGFGYHVNKLYRLGCEGELEFQTEETIRNIKQSILNSRREDHMSEKTAREEWDLLESTDWDNGLLSQYEWHDNTDLCDASEYFVYDYPPRVKALRDKLLPRFAKVVMEQLEKEEVKLING